MTGRLFEICYALRPSPGRFSRFSHSSKAVSRARVYVSLWSPNLCQLVSMFGGIVDISGDLGTAHTLSVWCWRFGAPKTWFSSFLIIPEGPRVLGHISTQVYPFSEENCAGPPTTICEGVPGPKHIPFVVPKWGTNGHKWGLCYCPAHAPSPG